jgi:hypothetical protein
MTKGLVCKAAYAALAAVCLILLPTQKQAHADEKRIHAKAGSHWNYTLTDEIRNTKSLAQQTLTETKDNQPNVNVNNTVDVFDLNWNAI